MRNSIFNIHSRQRAHKIIYKKLLEINEKKIKTDNPNNKIKRTKQIFLERDYPKMVNKHISRYTTSF